MKEETGLKPTKPFGSVLNEFCEEQYKSDALSDYESKLYSLGSEIANFAIEHKISPLEAEAIMVGSLASGFAFARIKHRGKVRQLKRDNK